MKKIALISPASPSPLLTSEAIEKLNDFFNRLGYEICLGKHALEHERYLAGTDRHRARDVMWAFTDPEIDMVLTIRGGYGSQRILDLLDYDLLRQNPKPFWTLSDGTALQTALYTRAGITGYSGVIGLSFLEPRYQPLMESCLSVLAGQSPQIPIQRVITSGQAEGIAVGGNLAVLDGLVGTPYFPDMTGKILVLEDVNESPYRVDRMLAHLRLAGILDQVAGVILGDFSTCVAKDPLDGGIKEVLKDYFGAFEKPVVQVDYGHGKRQVIIPIGVPLRIDTANQLIEVVE